MAPSSPLLEARKLTVGVAGKIFCRDLDFALAAGERLAILGRNGAGKSTLLSVLAGLRAPLSGEVRVKGASYAEHGGRRSALIRGWLPQSDSADWLSALSKSKSIFSISPVPFSSAFSTL